MTRNSSRNFDLLNSSPFFDAAHYRGRHMSPSDEIDALAHYLASDTPRSPGPFFDPHAYLAAYPDVAASGQDPLVHFIAHGLSEGRWAGLVGVQIPETPDYVWTETYVSPHDIETLAGSGFFDPDWYRRTYGIENDVDPIEHYLKHGHRLDFNPGPHFNTRRYREIHPDIVTLCPLLHYVRWGRDEGRALGLPDRLHALAIAGIKDLSELEPELMVDERLHKGLATLPTVFSVPKSRNHSAWVRVAQQLDGKIRHVVFAPWLTLGGADLVAVKILKALQGKYGTEAVALVLTDSERVTARHWLHDDTKIIKFIESVPLSLEERRTFVEKLIWMLRPKTIYNVNSNACWDAMCHSGEALSKMTSLRATMFCRDYSADGRMVGYSDSHFRTAIPCLDVVYFDNRSFMREMKEQYGLPAALNKKLRFLPMPSEAPIKVNFDRLGREKISRRLKVLWAGRLCFQKNLDLLEKIISLGQDFDFEIWGDGESEFKDFVKKMCARSENCTYRGAFGSLGEIEIDQYDAYLFTSHFEGMPTIILGMSAAGLPIVASRVGGVGEMVDEETGWPVDDTEDAAPYLRALRTIAIDAVLVDKKLNAMSARVACDRSEVAFLKGLFE